MKHHPCIIALCGYARSGKDSVGEILVREFDFVRVSFGDQVRAAGIDGWVLKHDVCGIKAGTRLVWNPNGPKEGKDDEGRRILQAIGEDARIEQPAYWLRRVLDRMDDDELDGRSIVVTDMRMHNEWTNLSDRGALTWRVKRRGVDGPPNNHAMEIEFRRFRPFTLIHNTSSLEDLEMTVAWHMADLGFASKHFTA